MLAHDGVNFIDGDMFAHGLGQPIKLPGFIAVSYTHLDVYKRQGRDNRSGLSHFHSSLLTAIYTIRNSLSNRLKHKPNTFQHNPL